MNSTIGICEGQKFELETHRTRIIQYCQGFSLKTSEITLSVALCIVVAAGGSFGNMVVILVIRRTPNLKTVCGVLIANLAVADLLVTAIAVPMVISGLTQCVVPQCSLSASRFALIAIGRYSTTASLLTLVALSIDRCWAIVSPLSHKLKMTSSKLKMVLVFIWLVSPVLPALEVFSRLDHWLQVRVRTAAVIACYAAIVASGIVTLMNVRHRSSKIRNLHENRSNSQISTDLRERDKLVAKTIALIVVVFSLCWVPILSIVAIFPDQYTRLHFWSGFFGLASSALNPCIYFYRQRNYRQAFKELVVLSLNLTVAAARSK